MQENLCLQCKRVSAGPTHRLVQDSCGHRKCRVCLLEDEEKCRQCEVDVQKTGTNGEVDLSVGVGENGDVAPEDLKKLVNNHTAVIKVNGNVSGVSKTFDKHTEAVVEEGECSSSAACEATYTEIPGVQAESFTADETINTTSASTRKRKSRGGKEKRAYNAIDIPKHITVIPDPLSYRCTICNKSFVTKAHVKYHVYCASAIKPYKCDVCQKEFILRAQLDVHSYKHKSLKLHTCSVCQKSFAERSKLTRHSALHSNVKSFICSECGNSYRSKESLRLHSIIHKGEKPYACKQCPAKFNNVSNLNKHVVSHSKEKAHMCDQCGRRFKLKWALTVHRKSHLRLRPFECSICSKTFVNKKELQRHGLIHADIKGYTCSICNMSLRRKDNLSRHMKNTHPGKKGEVIKNVVRPPKKPVDNPNAINVITASPAFTKSKAEALPPVKSDSRIGTVINGPIKLAFKTPAFKSNYNINRDFDYVPPPQIQKAYDMAESVDICQKILSPHTAMLPRTIIHKPAESEEILQKILAPYPAAPLHYETSFLNRKHALIKNIKFKVPVQYTNHFKEEKRASPPPPPATVDEASSKTYAELKPVAMTSVIVNTNSSQSNQSSSMHWRRRTSQNLNLKN